jgi:hypothetical protein
VADLIMALQLACVRNTSDLDLAGSGKGREHAQRSPTGHETSYWIYSRSVRNAYDLDLNCSGKGRESYDLHLTCFGEGAARSEPLETLPDA